MSLTDEQRGYLWMTEIQRGADEIRRSMDEIWRDLSIDTASTAQLWAMERAAAEGRGVFPKVPQCAPAPAGHCATAGWQAYDHRRMCDACAAYWLVQCTVFRLEDIERTIEARKEDERRKAGLR